MDKYEYKLRLQEIKSLIAKREYAQAATIADTIDWTRVKSVMMLCTISDLYKINRRLEDARDLLLLAYDRYPGGRSIVYSLCELFIKMDDVVQAVEYYKEFVQIAPKDNGRYILQYKLYEAQEVSLEERIEVLKELKSRDYIEKWAYELAYLYHRVGLGTKCVEECDELILWFGEGRYVMKAMELKMLHEPLTEAQQERYEMLKNPAPVVEEPEPQPEEASAGESQDASSYADAGTQDAIRTSEAESTAQGELLTDATREIPSKELDIQVKVMNVGQYDTINMQKELAENMKELWEETKEIPKAVKEEPAVEADKEDEEDLGITRVVVKSETTPFEVSVQEMAEPENVGAEPEKEEVFFGETGEISDMADLQNVTVGEVVIHTANMMQAQEASKIQASVRPQVKAQSPYDKILGMEYDGQMSLLVPESEKVEKQITGQISLEDVLVEWERMKKENEQKRMEAVQQHILQQTGAMFTEFEAATRDGLLEKLEKGKTVGLNLKDETEDLGEVEELEEIMSPEELEAEDAVEDESADGETADDALAEDADLEDISGDESEVSADFEDISDEVEEMEADEDSTEFFDEEEDLEDNDSDEEEFYDEDAEVEDDLEEASDEEFEAEDDEESDDEPYEDEYEDAEYDEDADDAEADDTDDADSEDSEDEDEDDSDDEYDEESEDDEDSEDEEDLDDLDDDAKKKAEKKAKEERNAKKPRGKRILHKDLKVRPLTAEEKSLFGAYVQNKHTRDQIIYAIDNVSMAAYTGNIILTGEKGMDTLTLAKKLIKEVQLSDSNFSGKTAKISGDSLNRRGVQPTIEKLANGALIIQKAGELKEESLNDLEKTLNQENMGIVVILEDSKTNIARIMKKRSVLKEIFNIHIHVESLDNDALVEYGKQYAYDLEYSIDDMGVLALHTCISERQTSEHVVTIDEVKEIMDDAIQHANKKTLGHFVDILIAKRYDEDDMIILRENDFR